TLKASGLPRRWPWDSSAAATSSNRLRETSTAVPVRRISGLPFAFRLVLACRSWAWVAMAAVGNDLVDGTAFDCLEHGLAVVFQIPQGHAGGLAWLELPLFRGQDDAG